MSLHRFLPQRNGPWCHLWRIQTPTHRHMALTADNSHLQWVGVLSLLASQLCQLQMLASMTVVMLDIFQTSVTATREQMCFIETGLTITNWPDTLPSVDTTTRALLANTLFFFLSRAQTHTDTHTHTHVCLEHTHTRLSWVCVGVGVCVCVF